MVQFTLDIKSVVKNKNLSGIMVASWFILRVKPKGEGGHSQIRVADSWPYVLKFVINHCLMVY
jgi:hypothetical protein